LIEAAADNLDFEGQGPPKSKNTRKREKQGKDERRVKLSY